MQSNSLTETGGVKLPVDMKERLELVRRMFCPTATNDELAMFGLICERTKLDPFAKQIFLIKRRKWNTAKEQYEDVAEPQISIEGARLTAERTGEYEGQTKVEWCGDDGKWTDVWLSSTPPAAARVGVRRKGFTEPLYAVARWSSYAVYNGRGDQRKLGARWAAMPDFMLGKCAEYLALRKAFPMEMAGLHGEEEMEKAIVEGVVGAPQLTTKAPETVAATDGAAGKAGEPVKQKAAPEGKAGAPEKGSGETTVVGAADAKKADAAKQAKQEPAKEKAEPNLTGDAAAVLKELVEWLEFIEIPSAFLRDIAVAAKMEDGAKVKALPQCSIGTLRKFNSNAGRDKIAERWDATAPDDKVKNYGVEPKAPKAKRGAK